MVRAQLTGRERAVWVLTLFTFAVLWFHTQLSNWLQLDGFFASHRGVC